MADYPMMRVDDVLREYINGDEDGWDVEFDYLRTNHSESLDNLARSVQEYGFAEPILLGYDGRVWDGHHRLCVAVALGIEKIPVAYAAGGRF